MKLTELFAKDQINLSFEVFPNKKPENLESVKAKTAKIAELKPAFMSLHMVPAAAQASLRWKLQKIFRITAVSPFWHT